jgi:hypothetical protein
VAACRKTSRIRVWEPDFALIVPSDPAQRRWPRVDSTARPQSG